MAVSWFGLGLIDQSLPNDEACDEGPASTSAGIKNVQTSGPVFTGRQNADNNKLHRARENPLLLPRQRLDGQSQ